MNLIVDHYGLHWMEGDIALLVQDTGIDHVLGIPMEFPVTLNTPRKFFCPHKINIEDVVEPDLPDDELVRAMMPVPKAQGTPALFVEDNEANFGYVKTLQRLSSSTHQIPLWYTNDKLAQRVGLTNLAPLVVFGYNEYSQQALSKLIQTAFHSIRQLIYIGPKTAILRPEMKRLDVKPVDLSALPLEQMGAWKLRQRMLGNDN